MTALVESPEALLRALAELVDEVTELRYERDKARVERDAALRRAETAEALLIDSRASAMVAEGARAAEAERFQLSHPEVPARPSEGQKRDAALALLEQHRAKLVALAKAIALDLSRRNGCVTSAEVLQELRVRGHAAMLDGVDARFMGAVFRRGFKQVGWERSGSHKRNQPVWAAVRTEP